jgi:hypothetical protein
MKKQCRPDETTAGLWQPALPGAGRDRCLILMQKIADYTSCCDNNQFITTTECGQNIFCNRAWINVQRRFS